MQFDEFGMNQAENRLIKSTLLKLMKQSTSSDNVTELRKLLVHFELVDASKNIDKEFMELKIDRNSKDYEKIMLWSKVFLKDKSFTTFAGDSSGKALLFAMERVFESFVAKHLKQALIDTDWEINLQDKVYYLFKNKFALRPDIVLKKDDRNIVIDTKWKLLNSNPGSNYGISQSDMYQMYAYAKKYNSKEIWLIYPLNDEVEEIEPICFDTNEGDNSAVVKVFFVNCYEIEESMISFVDHANVR